MDPIQIPVALICVWQISCVQTGHILILTTAAALPPARKISFAQMGTIQTLTTNAPVNQSWSAQWTCVQTAVRETLTTVAALWLLHRIILHQFIVLRTYVQTEL